jgi:DNA-binding NarL/FixJ family response regulator
LTKGDVSVEQRAFYDTRFRTSKIRCLLVDSHALLRQGVRRLLEDEPDIEVVGEAASAAEGLKKVSEYRPDIVLLDAGMPGLSCFDAARVVQRDFPDTRLMFLVTDRSQPSGVRGLRPDGVACVSKDASAPKLVGKIRDIYDRSKHATHSLRDHRFRSEEVRSGVRRSVLTPREREVVKMIAEGNSAKRIASLLGLSVKTVEAHRFNLMRKLDIHNKAQLVTYAIQKRIVKVPAEA